MEKYLVIALSDEKVIFVIINMQITSQITSNTHTLGLVGNVSIVMFVNFPSHKMGLIRFTYRNERWILWFLQQFVHLTFWFKILKLLRHFYFLIFQRFSPKYFSSRCDYIISFSLKSLLSKLYSINFNFTLEILLK